MFVTALRQLYTVIGQFRDNSGTTLRQLLDNHEAIFGANFTLREDTLETTLGYLY